MTDSPAQSEPTGRMRVPRVFAVVLAAGQSRRMGQPKQLLPYHGRTMVEAVLDAAFDDPRIRDPQLVNRNLDAVLLVTNPAVLAAVSGRLPVGLRVVVNDDPDSKMLASVQLALRDLEAGFSPRPDDGVLVLLGDQPQVTAETIATCAAAYRAAPGGITIATYQGRRGHPAVFAWSLVRDVLTWPTERRLSGLAGLHRERVCQLSIPCAPPVDVNTPYDLDRLGNS